MIRGALLGMAAAAIMAGLPAVAQTSRSTAGSVGSAALRNGYPMAGGAIALPAAPNAAASSTLGTNGPAATGAAGPGATGAGAIGGGPGFGASGGGGSGSTASGTAGSATATSGAARGVRGSAGRRGGGSWVVCPPDGASGEAALLTGTGLSCAPD